MRFLHTSDWHLGRSLFGWPRHAEQKQFLDWFVALVHEERADAVVIAGDIYDRSVPPVESVELLQDALIRISDLCPVVVIAGNHDSPTRLGFAGPLLERAGLHLRSSVSDIDRPVEVVGADGTAVLFYGLPYLDPESRREELDAERSHAAVLGAAMDRVRADLSTRTARSVVIAHAFITGGAAPPVVSESERDLRVGGIADAHVSVFDGADYVALGHLHGPQQVSTGSDLVAAYSGSPLAYSFSEESHAKSVTMVTLAPTGPAQITRIPVPVTRPMVTLRGTLEELCTAAEFAEHENSWVRAFYIDPRRTGDAHRRVRARFEWAPVIEHEPRAADLVDAPKALDPRAVAPLDLLSAFVEYVTETPVQPREQELLRESYERVLARDVEQ